MTRSVTEQIKKQASLESSLTELGTRHLPLKRGKNKPKNVPVSLAFNKVVSLSENPIVIDLNTGLLTPDVRTTNGFYTITYNPPGSPKYVKDKPFTFGQDMVRGRFCVSGIRHLLALCDRIPEFAFILKWSYFHEGLLAMAKKHPGIPFPFNFKWVEYGEMIEKKAEQMGIDIDHKPYLVYVAKKEVLEKRKEEIKMYPNPSKEDYQSVLEEIEAKNKEGKGHGRSKTNDN